MSNSPHILEHFIDSLATCPVEADLDTLFSLIQSSQCPTIAILDRVNLPIGVIDSHQLLIFILQQKLQVSQDREKFPEKKRDELSNSIIFDNFQLAKWIEPVTSLSVDLNLEEILAYFQTGVITKNNQQNYIVIDRSGKILGKLATFRLIQWLLSSQTKIDHLLPQQKTQKAVSLNLPIFQLIEQIPIPLTLQTVSGNILYQNQCWQKQIGKTEISKSLEVNKFVHSLNPDSPLVYSLFSPKQSTPYCLKGNYYQSPSFANLSPRNITFKSQKILDKLVEKQTSILDDHREKKLTELSNLDLPSLSLPKIKTEWKYIKLPLDWQENDLKYNLLTTKAWLIVALKIIPEEKLDSQPIKNNELVKLNQLKDEFLATISHELKSPLTSIVGLSSLLKEEKLGKLNQRQIRYSELIYRSGRQLMKIVGDILELTYLTTGKLQLNLELVQIKSLCVEVYQQVLAKLRESNLLDGKSSIEPQFKLSIAQNLEQVLADKIRLRQILVYLLDNALKFLQWKEATISNPQKKIEITIKDWHDWIAITIIDNGIGIAEEIQSLLFEQYFPSGNYQEHRYNDIALGLIMAQQLAKAHGGDISFVSCWDRGSKFTLLLPSASAKVAPDRISHPDSIASLRQSLEISYSDYHRTQQSPEYTIDPKSNKLVLLVDSVVARINQLDLKLEELGYYLIIARTATEAIQKARQFRPIKILLDSALSNSAETDILALLKSDLITAKIPVFLLVNRQKEQKKHIQADGFLTVPIKQEYLVKILPLIKKDLSEVQKSLTILHLYPESEITSNLKIIQNSDLNFALNEHLSGLNHRVLEADSLEQGELLARIWQIDAILLDGRILQEPLLYLRSLRKSEQLSSLPLVTLDTKTTEAANQIEGLSVFPCLLPEEKSNLANLVQVIQIAAGIKNNN